MSAVDILLSTDDCPDETTTGSSSGGGEVQVVSAIPGAGSASPTFADEHASICIDDSSMLDSGPTLSSHRAEERALIRHVSTKASATAEGAEAPQDQLVRAKSTPNFAIHYSVTPASLVPPPTPTPALESPSGKPAEVYQESEYLIYSERLGMHFSESGGVFTVTQSASATATQPSGTSSAASSSLVGGVDVAQDFDRLLELNGAMHSGITKDLMTKWRAAQTEKSTATRRKVIDFNSSTFIVAQQGVSPTTPATPPVFITPASPAASGGMSSPTSAALPLADAVDATRSANARVLDPRTPSRSAEKVIGPHESLPCPYDVPSALSPRLRDVVESHVHHPSTGRPAAASPAGSMPGPADQHKKSTVKMLYEGDEIFGYGVKKTMRIDLIDANDAEAVVANIALIQDDLISKTNAALSSEKLRSMKERSVEAGVLLSFFDAELDTHVVLEADNWTDFMDQAKKMLRVALIEVPISYSTSETIDTKIDVCIKTASQETVGGATSPVVSPMSPSYGESGSPVSNEVVYGEWAPTQGAGPEVGSELIMINGIKVVGLRRRLVFNLLSQRSRPILLMFRKKVDRSFVPKGTSVSPSSVVVSAYDDEWDSGDESAISDSTTVQLSAVATPNPGAAAMQLSIGRGPTWARKRKVLTNESVSVVPIDVDRLSYDMFLSKYFAPQGMRMRKKVDESISAFVSCNWREANSTSSVSQQETIKSLYKYIETELLRLGLFNKNLQQGSDAPEMTDKYKARLGMHIERFVLAQVHQKILEPSSPAFEAIENYTATVNRLKTEAADSSPDNNDVLDDFGKFHFATLAERIAFLRFLKLEDLGLSVKQQSSQDYVSKVLRCGILSRNQDISVGNISRQLREDWNIALWEVVDALSNMSRTPSDISRRIQSAVALATSAAERFMETGTVYREQIMSIPVHPRDWRGPLLCSEGGMEYRNMYRKMAAGSSLLNQDRPVMGADELLPVVTWLLIQANPQNAERCLAYCSEFLSADLARGQANYTLAQVMSALEFIKSAGPDELLCTMHPSGSDENDEEEIKKMRRVLLIKYASYYKNSLNLLKSCKRGDVNGIEKWLSAGADINVYSTDQRNTPLTLAVRFAQKDAIRKLLSNVPTKMGANGDPKSILDVNLPVGLSLSDPPPHRYTALHIAVSIGDTEAVVNLLKAGADRYAKDSQGNSPLNLASKAEYSEILKILLADPEVHGLVPSVLSGQVALVEGLLKQGVKVDAIDSNYGISGFIAAIHAMHECILAIFLSHYRASNQAMMAQIPTARHIVLEPFSLDCTDAAGTTALMWCGKAKSLSHGLKTSVKIQKDLYYTLEEIDPQNVRDLDDLTRMKLAIRLCAAGANRYAVDRDGRSALWWAIHGNGAVEDLGITTNQVVEQLQTAQEKSKKTSSSLTSILDVCKFPRLAAVLYFDPERFSIFELARDNCFEGVRALLDQGEDPNAVCPVDGYVAITAAAYNGNASIVELLIADHRTNLDFCNYRTGGFTALHYCASRGDAVLCGRLLFAGASRAPQSKTGKTPFDLAVDSGHKSAADVCRYDPEKVSVCLAAKHGDVGITRVLLLQGVSINTTRRHKNIAGKVKNQLYTPLIAASVYGRVDYIKFLLSISEGASDANRNDECIRRETLLVDLQNPDGNTALMCAAMVGNENIVLLLLNRGHANRYIVDGTGRVAADWALKCDHKIVHEILVNDPDRCCIHDCVAKGDLRSVVALLKQNVNTNVRFMGASNSRGPAAQSNSRYSSVTAPSPDNSSQPPPTSPSPAVPHPKVQISPQLPYFIGETPLAVAARFNASPILKLLLQAPDIQIDARDEEGVTALGRAAQMGHEESVLVLLNHKANRYQGKKKPVDLALAAGHVTIAALIEADPEKVSCHDLVEAGRTMLLLAMLKQGYPVNSVDPRPGRNAEPLLVCAARNGKGEIVWLLLANENIAINAADATGATALMRAAGRGDLQICEQLVAHPLCNPDLRDCAGKKASDYALSHGYVFYTRFMMCR